MQRVFYEKGKAMQYISLYDTTLRDGAQCEDLNLSTSDKIKIALRLDELGIPYIEGGWPGSNPVDTAFFKEIKAYKLKNAQICAFGSTFHPSNTAETDPTLAALIAAETPVCTIFGKSCERHVTEALRTTPERNLDIIRESVAFLKRAAPTVFFDAEHFFDGFKRNSQYALAALKAAQEGGASALVLCDTNGGTLPSEISAIMQTVREALPDAVLGIHAHNDCEMAVANSVAAVQAGAVHVQGTINGYGERCGNANLCSIAPILQLKCGGAYSCLPEETMPRLTATSFYVAEVTNVTPLNRQPFVGRSAFAHKAGMHVSAVNRDSTLYEHIFPASVGNSQRVLITEMGGRSNIVSLAKRFGFHLDKDEPVVKGLYNELNKKASQGYDFATAEASVELLVMRKLGRRGVRDFFRLLQYHISSLHFGDSREPVVEVTVKVEVEGVEEFTAATGNGPVNALDRALRKAISQFYPRVREMRLRDFKVRVLNSGPKEGNSGTASLVRVLIESGDSDSHWVTVGVSHDVIEASRQALVDSITYKLYRDEFIRRAGGKGKSAAR